MSLPRLGELLFPGAWFQGPEAAVYLSFDDGPDPEHSLRLARIAAERQAGLSFFCLGERLQQHPEVAKTLLELGHQLGYHGHQHLNGWRTSKARTVQNARPPSSIGSGLFRPPYGRLWPGQYREIARQQQVVFWTSLPGDYRSSLPQRRVERTALSALKPGAIIALHDWSAAGMRSTRLLPVLLRELEQLRLPALALPSVPSKKV